MQKTMLLNWPLTMQLKKPTQNMQALLTQQTMQVVTTQVLLVQEKLQQTIT